MHKIFKRIVIHICGVVVRAVGLEEIEGVLRVESMSRKGLDREGGDRGKE